MRPSARQQTWLHRLDIFTHTSSLSSSSLSLLAAAAATSSSYSDYWVTLLPSSRHRRKFILAACRRRRIVQTTWRVMSLLPPPPGESRVEPPSPTSSQSVSTTVYYPCLNRHINVNRQRQAQKETEAARQLLMNAEQAWRGNVIKPVELCRLDCRTTPACKLAADWSCYCCSCKWDLVFTIH